MVMGKLIDLGLFHNITLFSSRFLHYYSGWTGRTQDAARTERLFDNCIVYAGNGSPGSEETACIRSVTAKDYDWRRKKLNPVQTILPRIA